MRLRTSIILGALLAAATPIAAQAATLVVNLRDVRVNAPIGDPSNVVQTYDIGAYSELVGFGFDLVVMTRTPSYLSEAMIHITDSTGAGGLTITPGADDERSGRKRYSSDVVDLRPEFNFRVGADGLLRLEYADSSDDYPGAWDDTFNGTLTFVYDRATAGAVPEPATWAIMTLGFGVTGASLRRRRLAVGRRDAIA